MSDLVRKEIHDIFETKKSYKRSHQKIQKRIEKELDNDFNSTFMYVRSYLMSKIIENCSGEKGRGEKNR